jgi:GGDEF domain-containing protein
MPAHALSHQRSRDERDGLLSPAAFAAALEATLRSNEQTIHFVGLLLVDIDTKDATIVLSGAAPRRDRVLDRVLEEREAGESAARQDDGSLALLHPTATTPAAAIERCDRLLRTVRAAVRTRAGRPLATASVGLALAPGLEPGAGALLDGVHRAMRTAQREGGDQWAAA